MKGLRIAKGLTLPLDAVTQTFGILSVRGAGKSNTAAVMAEEMYANGLPFVVVDPEGSWWGLRSSKDGKGPGLPIPIFGGARGDVPLEETAGAMIAELIARERLSCVLDVSDFSETKKRRFLTDFANTILRKNQDQLHLFLEEADDYAPQSPGKGEPEMLRAWQNVVKRGRKKGLGITMITQRSAALNKNVLTQIETLIVLRTTSPQDRKAVQGWIDYYAQSKEVLADLPTLKNGEAYVWSPSWLGIMEKVKVYQRGTFDSAATPKGVRKKRRLTTLADIDLGAIREQMAETIERAKETDPKELKKRVAQLERELVQAQKEQPTPEPEIVEVPALTSKELNSLEGMTNAWNEVAAGLDREGSRVLETARNIQSSASRATEIIESIISRQEAHILKKPVPAPSPMHGGASAPPKPEHPEGRLYGLVAGERRILEALASFHPGKLTRSQVAVLAGLRPNGSSFRTYAGRLRRHGLVSEPEAKCFVITDKGMGHLGYSASPDPMTTKEVQAMWMGKFSAGARKMLQALIDSHPQSIHKNDLAKVAQLEPGGSSYRTYIGQLRRNGLAETSGELVKAGEALFL